MLRMMEWIATLLPIPVAPAMSRWGIESRAVTTGVPRTFFPNEKVRRLSESRKTGFSRISLRLMS
ncbi:MAG: hypothetical protein BWY86_01328 [Candidatus Aminicenantes bacterium ADurb.Bin508]|nr:MAG: hypothetical protein BWY86_01328 [Candidatus Aminicenantes bacterium ADurb.Bin508]